MTNHEIWQAVLADFELKVSKANFTTWFRSTGIGHFTPEGEVVICVPNTFTKSWLEKKYHSEIVRLLERIAGRRIKKADYRVENIKHIQDIDCSFPSPSAPAAKEQLPAYPREGRTMLTPHGLNLKYTFNSFVVGKGNELAHAAAQAAAARPGDAYNPLFIYGGVGLGKTHLLQAMAHTMIEQNPRIKVLYGSSEKFTGDFVNAVKEGRAKEFKDRYRNVDLLLIDDVQFFSGKEQTQEEFFHTFNELHQAGKQIVLTSDRPPKAIPALEDRLRSRLGWGMIADIAPPDLETRVAILQTKCQEKQFAIESTLLQQIAIAVQSNIRDLEGALNKVIALHQLKNMAPSKETVKSVLASFENQSMKKSVTPRELISTVAVFYDIALDDILGKSREKRISFPRQIIMFLLREELKLSYPAIGSELGGRDHTTAMHAHGKITTGVSDDLKLKQDIELIRQRMYAQPV